MITIKDGQELHTMNYEFVVSIGGINLSNVTMKYEKRFDTVWIYVGETLISNVCLKFYSIKYHFTDTDTENGTKTIFFNITKKVRK